MTRAIESTDEDWPTRVGELLGQVEWVRGLARSMALDSATAEDLSQAALAAALTGRPPSGAALRRWLAGTVRNLSRRHRREEANRSAREASAATSAPATDPAGTLAEAEAHRRLVEHVFALDPVDLS